MAEETKEAKVESKPKEAPRTGSKKVKRQDKSTTQRHLLKSRSGTWGGSTWCGINYRHKSFFDRQIEANLDIVDCEKCLKKMAEHMPPSFIKGIKEKSKNKKR